MPGPAIPGTRIQNGGPLMDHKRAFPVPSRPIRRLPHSCVEGRADPETTTLMGIVSSQKASIT